MQWNQIKTLFILCFLILDVYLLVKFMDKQEQTDLGVLEHENTSIEQQLEAEDITIPEFPYDIDEEEHYISVSPKKFTQDDISELDNQSTVILDDHFIVSTFKDPIKVPKDDEDSSVDRFLANDLLFPEEYVFWDWNKELNMLIYFQRKEDKPIYYNESGIIFVFLNDENEATFYTQTMLEQNETDGDKFTLIEPIKAIETLYNSNELTTDDEVSSIDMGFHTRIPLESGVQVFSPTWRVKVNEERNYFVNAIEGIVSSSKDITFLEESIKGISEKVEEISDDSYKKNITKLLEKRLKLLEGGEMPE